MVKDMTSGKPVRLILAFALPLLLGNLFQQVYNMVDSSIVGKFVGKEALAAVGATGSISFLVIGFATGIASGFGILVALFFGSGEYDRLRNCVANIIYLSAGISLVLTVLSVLLTRPMLNWMNTPENIIEDSYNYIVIIFAGIAASLFYNVLANILRALGDSRSPLYFLIVASLLNVVLDLLFVIAFRMGTAGAGLATVLSQAVSALLCLFYMKKKMPILHLSRTDFRPDVALMKRLLALGLPMALQFSITAVGTIILQAAVNSLGSDAVAAVTAGNKVQSIVTMPMESLGITMATFCSQNLGAGKVQRANKGVHQCLMITLIYSVVACILIRLVGHYIALLFLDAKELTVLADVKLFLSIGSLFYPELSVLFVYRNSIQGLGYSVPAMAAGVFELVARAGISFLFVYRLGFTAACYAAPIAWVAAIILLIPVYYYTIHKLKKREFSIR